MYFYKLVSYGYDTNDQYWLYREEECENFEELVAEISQKIVVEEVRGEPISEYRKDTMPWWEGIVDLVALDLIENYEFNKLIPNETISKEWTTSFMEFCPNPQEIIDIRKNKKGD